MPVPAGTDAENHVVVLDGFEVAALVGTLGLDGAAAEGPLASGFGKPAKGGIRIGDHDAQHAAQVAIDELVAGFSQMLVIGEQLFGAGHVARSAFEFNAVGAEIDVDVQAVFEHVEVFVARAEQGSRC